MVKGVIFDVDGVLLNSMPVWENLGELYLQRLGIEAEKDLGTKLYTMSLEQSAQYLIQTYHLDLTPEEVIAGVNQEVKDFYAERVPLKEGVRQYANGDRHDRGQEKCGSSLEEIECIPILPGDFYLFGDREQQERTGHLLRGSASA